MKYVIIALITSLYFVVFAGEKIFAEPQPITPLDLKDSTSSHVLTESATSAILQSSYTPIFSPTSDDKSDVTKNQTGPDNQASSSISTNTAQIIPMQNASDSNKTKEATAALSIPAATHPKAHEAMPLLPTKVTDGWILNDIQPLDRPISFIEAKGYQAHYVKPTENGATFTMLVDILQIAGLAEAETVFDRLSALDSLAATTEKLEMTGLKKIVFRQGSQDSPDSSSQALPLTIRRVVAWFPPFVVRFETQNAPFGIEEVKSILASLAWRQ